MRQQTYVNKKPTLYIVSTPIGNMSEFTPRAIEILKSVELIACEDTRTSKILLDHFDIGTRLASYHKFNERESAQKFLDVLESGKDIALISDAGYPLVSDPGSILVDETIKKGFNVTTISGASAFLNALVSSNMSLKRFTFIGFLDSKRSSRKKQLEEIKGYQETMIFYESPHRIRETLEDLLLIFGDRKMVLARELTKKFEEYIRGNVSEVLEELDGIKGEIVLIVDGAELIGEGTQDDIIESEILKLVEKDIPTKEIVEIICGKYDVKKNKIYDLVCEIKKR